MMKIGEINTGRGLLAKRNLFVFCSTILILNFTSNLDISEFVIFGLRPFDKGSDYAWYAVIIIGAYLLFYWIYQYYQGWLSWREGFKDITHDRPIKIFFWQKYKYLEGGQIPKTTIITTEDSGGTYYNFRTSWIDNERKEMTSSDNGFSIASVTFLRLQITVYLLGVGVLTILSLYTAFVLCGKILEANHNEANKELPNSHISIMR